jgi:hypothetical protein
MPKLPTIKELSALIKEVKRNTDWQELSNDCRASDDSEDTLPGIQLTCGINYQGDWSYQTGDNSYTGGAYGYPCWAVISVYRRSNSRELAREILDQWQELLWDAPEAT